VSGTGNFERAMIMKLEGKLQLIHLQLKKNLKLLSSENKNLLALELNWYRFL
tara:strand:- start:532 stop:687 length:156 start_codon:yes stop_codon:yes gene_type:complete